MRSLRFDSPDDLLDDEHSVIVDVYIEEPGGDDEDGNPKPPERTYYLREMPGDLQPRSGSQRAAQSGTAYESTHLLFLYEPWTEIPPGATVEARNAGCGDVLGRYTVVFVADWGTHLEIDLKAVP